MKIMKFIVLSMFLASLMVVGCKVSNNSDQTNPVLTPEDVFSLEILSQIRTQYDIGNNELEITYIGNHGYLFSTLSKRVIIDSLSEIGGGYERTSEVILSMFNEAEFPFNNIQLALSTHSHGDHFDVNRVVDFLIANPQSTHLTTQGAEILLQGSTQYNQISSQSMGITPDPNSSNQVVIAGVRVKVFRLDHHGVSDYDHVAIMFTLNGIKVLHVGDACKIPSQYEGLGLGSENIDILIAPFGSSCANWTVAFEEENPFDIINQYIRPRHIIVSHLDFDTTAAEIQEIIDLLEENLPGIDLSVFHPTILGQKIYIKEGNNIQVIDKPSS